MPQEAGFLFPSLLLLDLLDPLDPNDPIDQWSHSNQFAHPLVCP